MSDKFKPNPSLFREMAKPYSNLAEAEKEISAFFEGIEQLREKHHIETAYVILRNTAMDEEGREIEFHSTFSLGNQLLAESLCAYAFGTEQARRQERIAAILASSGTVKQRPHKK